MWPLIKDLDGERRYYICPKAKTVDDPEHAKYRVNLETDQMTCSCGLTFFFQAAKKLVAQ